MRTFDGDSSRKLARAGPCVCGSVRDLVARARKCAVSCEKTTYKYVLGYFTATEGIERPSLHPHMLAARRGHMPLPIDHANVNRHRTHRARALQ